MRPSRQSFETPTFVSEIIIHPTYPQFQITYAIVFLLVLDLHAGKVLCGQVDHDVGSVDNIVELV